MPTVAVFGLGGVAERIHLPACRQIPEIEVLAACEPSSGTRSRMASKFGLENVYETAEELLERHRPAIVLIGAPPDSHLHLCRLALESGAHVLCEKPFMASLEEADAMIALAREKGRYLAVNNQYRYMRLYQETKRRLAAGEFGRLYYLQCWQQMLHPPAREKVAWRRELRQSALFEFGTHALDLICYFLDALPLSLTAHTPRVRPEYPSDVLVHASMRFPEERLATLSLNRVTHAPERYLEMRLDCENASLRISLGGVARLSIEWSSRLGRPTSRLSFVKGGEARAEAGGRSRPLVKVPQQEFMTATAAHLRQFLRQIERRPPDLAAARHAREVLRLAFAGYESATAGETLHFPS